MNSEAIRRDAAAYMKHGHHWLGFLNPGLARTSVNTAVILECIADMNDRIEHLEGLIQTILPHEFS